MLRLRFLLVPAVVSVSGSMVYAQGVRPQPPRMSVVQRHDEYDPAVPRMRDYSWTYIDSLAPRQVKVHDLVTVMVNENSEVIQNSRYDRQRNATLKMDLKSFIRLGEDWRLRPAAQDNPKIDTQLRSQLNSFGNASSKEGMRYRIAATVVEVLPNGTLVLEARKKIQTNTELWEYKLTGRVRSQDVTANNTVLSENIAELTIAKIEHGKVYDSTKRGWVMRLYDAFLPW